MNFHQFQLKVALKQWQQITGKQGSQFTKSGQPVRYQAVGTREGVKIKIIIEPEGQGIITGYQIH